MAVQSRQQEFGSQFWLGDLAQVSSPLCALVSSSETMGSTMTETPHRAAYVVWHIANALRLLAIHVINAAGSGSILLRKWHGKARVS